MVQIKKHLKATYLLFKEAVIGWSNANASMLAAALAFYAIFSLAPLLAISVAVAGALLGEEAVQQELVGQVERMVSLEVAQTVKFIIENATRATAGIVPTLINLVLGLLGASIVFRQLKISLNIIWGIAPQSSFALRTLVRRHLLPFAVVLISGFLLTLSIVISTILALFNRYLGAFFPGTGRSLPLLDLVLSLIVLTFLFALLIKTLPDARVAWRDVWLGAAVSSVLFTIGKYLMSFYLSNVNFGAAYGSATSFVVLLFWVYLSAQIFLFGAKVTHVFANRYGSSIVPADYALQVVRQPLHPESQQS